VNGGVEYLPGPAFADHAAALDADDGLALDTCADRFIELGDPLLAAETAVQAAEAHARAGRRRFELAALARAQRWAESCEGARTPVLARAGQPPTAASLTRREREIAELAVRGLSNQDIAETLVLSRRTVGNHLNNVYQKLGLTSRAELAGFLEAGPKLSTS
jgi:DNA-binding NarL/FixJ family response regulator